MSRNRFFEINHYLHFNNNSMQASHDYPTCCLKSDQCLNESRRLFPSTTYLHECFCWWANDRNQSKYIIFAGSPPKNKEVWDDTVGSSRLTFLYLIFILKQVMVPNMFLLTMWWWKLMQGHLDESRQLYVDNYYTSPWLFLDLEDRGKAYPMDYSSIWNIRGYLPRM